MFWWETKTHAVVRQLLIRPETGGHGFHYIADGVLSRPLVYQTSADLGRFMMLR